MGPTPPERQSCSRKDTPESSALCYWKLRSNNERDGNTARATVGHTWNDEKTHKAFHYIQDVRRPPRWGLGGLFDNKQRKKDSGKPWFELNGTNFHKKLSPANLFVFLKVNLISIILSVFNFYCYFVYLKAVLSNFQLSSFGREKMKFLKLSQMNGLDNWFTKNIFFSSYRFIF